MALHKNCKIGWHRWGRPKYVKRLNGLAVMIEEAKCTRCGEIRNSPKE
jgi:hypothetical protein